MFKRLIRAKKLKLGHVMGIELSHHQETRNFPVQGRGGMLKCMILDLKSGLRLAGGIDTTFKC